MSEADLGVGLIDTQAVSAGVPQSFAGVFAVFDIADGFGANPVHGRDAPGVRGSYLSVRWRRCDVDHGGVVGVLGLVDQDRVQPAN